MDRQHHAVPRHDRRGRPPEHRRRREPRHRPAGARRARRPSTRCSSPTPSSVTARASSRTPASRASAPSPWSGADRHRLPAPRACRRAVPARDDEEAGRPTRRRRQRRARGRAARRAGPRASPGAPPLVERRDTDAVSDAAVARPAPTRPASYSRERYVRTAIGLVFLALFLGNLAAIVWIWVANHNLDFSFAPDLTSAWMARLGGLTGLLGAYLALVQVLLLARLPFLGRRGGLRPAHRLASLERLRVPRARRRPHRPRGLGYAIDGHVASSTSSGRCSPTTSCRDGHGDDRARALRRRLRLVDHDRRGASSPTSSGTRCTSPRTPAIALAWFHEIPTGGDINPAFHRTQRPTGASSSSARSPARLPRR